MIMSNYIAENGPQFNGGLVMGVWGSCRTATVTGMSYETVEASAINDYNADGRCTQTLTCDAKAILSARGASWYCSRSG